MKPKHRETSDREGMRRTILDAARSLFVHEGYGQVSMRRVAEEAGCSAASIYNYFPGKADVLLALAEEGWRRFVKTLPGAGEGDDPLAALERHFWRYYEFSKRQPDYYWLAFVDRAVCQPDDDWERFEPARRARDEGIALLARCAGTGLLSPSIKPPAAYRVLAAAIHGASVARLGGRLCARRHADAVARDTLRTAIAGLRPAVAPDSSAAADPTRPAAAPERLAGTSAPAGPGSVQGRSEA